MYSRKHKITEKQYIKTVKDRLQQQGCLVFKITERFRSGFPDLIVICAGIVMFVECKVGNNTLSSLQLNTLFHIAKAGGIALLIQMSTAGVETVVRIFPDGSIRSFKLFK